MSDANPKLLIVDDDIALAKTLAGILKRSGYEVQAVHAGQQGVDALKNDAGIDVVLIDIRLPDMNGLDVLKAVKRINAETGAIMVTGHAETETAVEALNQGAFAYIQKPYNPMEVKSAIERVLEKQRLTRENKELLSKLQEYNKELGVKVQEKTSELQDKNLQLLAMIERLEELNESKSRFVANASHELQTPMTSLIGFSSMLVDYGDSLKKEERDKFLLIIRDETLRLARLSSDLLDISRIQEGRITLKFKKVNLESLAEKVREKMKMVKEKVSIDISFDDKSRTAITDEDKMHQVLTNLVGNALKYSPDQSSVKITGKKTNGIITVSVSDQGPGIPDDEKEKIFEPFYRVQSNANQKIKGTGLGLPIAKAIVEALGGKISVQRNKDKGTSFSFTVVDGIENPEVKA